MSRDVLWLEQRLSDVPDSADWLSRNEQERLRSFKFPKRRIDWRLGRWTAKTAVAAWLADSRDLTSIEIIPDAAGAPEVWIAGERPHVAISLSHSAGVAVCALVEDGPIGCDIEVIEPRTRAFIADYFTDDEQGAVAAAGINASTVATLIWSAKESALKALREGLRRDTRSVAVKFESDHAGTPWNPLTVHCEGGEVLEGVWCCADGFVRTVVAAEQPTIRVAQDFIPSKSKANLVSGLDFSRAALASFPCLSS